MASRLRALETFDVSTELWRLDIPTLVLAGTRDVIVNPDRQRALSEAIGGAKFEIVEGAGHLGFVTHRQNVARVMTRWMRTRSHTVR